ncbi:hypothetical protein RQP46_003364 [Phenoliferia psychrophenolica]
MSPTGPSLPPLSAVGTRDRLAGHTGHLTTEQEDALVEFKAQLAKDGFYTPPTDTTPPSHDEPTLLRFLRARKFDVEGAVLQFTTAEKWRRDEKVGETYDEFPVPEFRETEKVYPQWTGRRDKAGLPVYVFKISGLTKEAINAYNKEPERLTPRMVALYEHMVQFALPFCSSCPRSHEETPVSATTTIVDISNVSLSRFWGLRAHMQRASTLATAMYAETLGTIYIVGAPNFFSVVWGWIGKWFDPGTVEKIFILKDNEVLSTLSRFIDPENIPKQFGGDLDWAFGDLSGPTLDKAAQETLGLDAVPRGSVRWIDGELVVKGTGRTEEELAKCVPRKKEKNVEVQVPTTNGTDVAPVNGAPETASPPVEDDDEADEWSAAMESPTTPATEGTAVPVGDLSATLEKTTL